MATVRRYSTRTAADEAVAALRASGILATVVDDLAVLGSDAAFSRATPYAVMLGDAADRESACRIIEDLDAHPLPADPGWEDTAADPDLSRLDPNLSIPCPTCSHDLRAVARPVVSEITCPECGGSVDVIEVILGRHGPEALARCFPVPEGAIAAGLTASDHAVDAAPLYCSGCGYSLAGLPQESHCPECGRSYSKRRMLRS